MRRIGQALGGQGVTLAVAMSSLVLLLSDNDQAHNTVVVWRIRRAARVLILASTLVIACPVGALAQPGDLSALSQQAARLCQAGKCVEAIPPSSERLRSPSRSMGPPIRKSAHTLMT